MWLLLIICVVLFVVKVNTDWRRRSVKHYPPGPRRIPFIGNLLEVSRIIKETGFDWGAWKRLSESYGSILQVRMGHAEPCVIVSGHKAVHELLARREFDGRPNTFELRMRNLGKPRGIVFNDGPDWVKQKRFALKVLKDFGFGKRTMEELVSEDTSMLCNAIKEKVLDKEIDLTNFVEMTAVAVVSSLWNLISSKRCDVSNPNSDISKVVSSINDSFRNGGISDAIWRYLPFFNFIKPLCPGFANHKKRFFAITNFFSKEVSFHKTTRLSGQPRDLIDAYLDQIESSSQETDSSFNELQLIVLLKDLFTAGIETTSNLIGFIILYLVKHPDKQTKVQDELDKVIGKFKVPRLEQKSVLPYLNATIAEVSRLANVAPTTIAHRAVTNCSLLGYDVEKNWSVIADLRSVHMDPDHWAEPESFRPERFIDQNGNFVEDPWLIPFGAGRRKCPGENLARISLFLFIASMFQKFRFSLAPKETAPCMLGVNGFTLAPPQIKIIIKSRCNDSV